MADTRIGGVYATFRAQNSHFLRASRQNIAALRRQRAETKRFQKALRDLRRDARAITSTLQTLGRRTGLAASVGVGFAVRSFAQLEQTLATVRGVTGATVVQFASLSAQARKLGRTTRFTARQAAEGQLFLARAGFKVNQVYSALPGTLLLAQAATVELGEAADIVSNVLAGFGAGAGETEKFADVLAKTTISANTNLLQLADAIKLVGPISKSLDVTLETTAASIGILSNAGLQATLAGTGLRRVMFNLEAPTKAVTSILDDLNLTTKDVSISQNGLIKVLERLSEAGITAREAILLFGARGAPAFNVLVKSIPQLKELEAALHAAAGTTAELARIQDDTLVGSFFKLVSASDGLGRAFVRVSGLGASLKSSFFDLADSINDLTDYIVQNIGTILDRTRAFAELLFGVFLIRGPLGRAIVNLAIMARSVGYVTVALRAATAVARFFFRLFLIGFIIEGFLLLIDTISNMRGSMQKVVDEFGNFFVVGFLDGLSDIANAFIYVENLSRDLFNITNVAEVDLARLFLGDQAIRDAEHFADEVGFAFNKALKERLRLFGIGEQDFLNLEGAITLPEPETLPTPSFEDIAAKLRAETESASALRTFRAQTFDLERDIRREIEATVREREREAELVGLSGRELEVAAARQGVLTRFAEERIKLLINEESILENITQAKVAELDAIVGGNLALARSAERAQQSAKLALANNQEQISILDEQLGRAEALADAAEREAVSRGELVKLQSALETTQMLTQSITSSFGEFAVDAVLSFDKIGDAVKKLARAILNDLVQALIVAQIRAAALSFLGGLGGGGAGGFAIPGLQHGGRGSGFAVVGEGGPELVDFRRPGRVYSNDELSAAISGGGAPYFNFAPIIQSSDGPAVRRAVLESFPIFEERVLRRFAGDMRRPSALRTATRG